MRNPPVTPRLPDERWWRSSRIAATVITAILFGATMAATARPPEPSRAAERDATGRNRADPDSAGDSLSVYLLTVGQGDAVWERFGHNAIGVRDRRTNSDVLYNWGLFDFGQPDFIARFVHGDMRYWMAGSPAAVDIPFYEHENRDITIQELNLTPAQRHAVLAFVLWNSREENKYYRYDYFRDNCSTRVRDALDRVLNGALRAATSSEITTQSYRDHALRLMTGEKLVATGIDIGLGRPADRPISVWDEMFIPMRMRDRLRSIQVTDADGRALPLVASERAVWRSGRTPEAHTPPRRAPAFLLIGTAVAALLLLAAGVVGPRATPRAGVARALTTIWSLLVGTIGVLLLYLRFGTAHVFAYHNLNLLQYNPLWCLVGLLLPFARRGARLARLTVDIGLLGGLLTAAAMVLSGLPSLRQDNLAVVLLAAPVNIAVAVVTWRVLSLPGADRAR